MLKIEKPFKRVIAAACVGTMALSLLSGCGKKPVASTDPNQAATISVMLQTFTGEPVSEASPVKKEVEKLTNTKLDLRWVPSSTYGDKLNLVLASGEPPQVMYVGSKSSSIINAVRAGAFWEVGPYLKDYTHLSKANPVVIQNTSIDGKLYGLYRSRALGRNGMVFRKDWLQNLGLEEPKTIDDLYNVLKAFTTKDPDQNGKNDTYGMIVTNFFGPMDQLAVWFGAPNGWGEDAQGNLTPMYLTDEYLESVKFLKKLYEEGLMNKDFAVMDASKWNDPFIAGKAGVIIDTTDRANSLSTKSQEVNPKARVDIIGAVAGPKGYRTVPTSGYAGFFMFHKQGMKTEADLKRALAFFDKIHEKQVADLITNGIEGRHYKAVDGYKEEIKEATSLKNEWNDFQQIATFIDEDQTYKIKPTEVSQKITKVQKENEKTIVANPGEALISSTYATRGPQLDAIIKDARVKYIVGQLDDAGFKAEMERWHKSGGDEYIKEMNAEYKKIKK